MQRVSAFIVLTVKTKMLDAHHQRLKTRQGVLSLEGHKDDESARPFSQFLKLI